MLEEISLLRSLVFDIVFAGIEYRYINRREEEWTKSVEGFAEKPAFWLISPYQAYLLMPLFIVAGSALPLTAWAANVFLIALVEDIAYFVWRGRGVVKGEWTTQLFGSFNLARVEVPIWWPLALALAAVLSAIPV